MRGREEIARLTVRLRSEYDEYESAAESWSPEADERKKELRKARADTLVEIGAALTWLGEVELFREIERLPFEQKLEQLDAFLEPAQGRRAAPPPQENPPPPDPVPSIPYVDAEPVIAFPAPAAAPLEAPRPATEPPRLASLPARSMRPRVSRRPIGHWPVRLAPSAMPRAATRRVPLLVAVIAVQGLALAVLSIAVLRITPRSSESDPARAATGNATAAAIAPVASPLPPPAPPPAVSGIPPELPVAAPAFEPRTAAAAPTPRRAAPSPRPPPRLKPAAVPAPAVLARQPEIFSPDTL